MYWVWISTYSFGIWSRVWILGLNYQQIKQDFILVGFKGFHEIILIIYSIGMDFYLSRILNFGCDKILGSKVFKDRKGFIPSCFLRPAGIL